MKKRILIITAVLLANLLALSFKSHAQTYAVYKSENFRIDTINTVLLADETVMKETKTGAKIECSSDHVHFKLYSTWQHCFLRYSWVWKKDRHGVYKQYVISVSKKDADLIKTWAKDNL